MTGSPAPDTTTPASASERKSKAQQEPPSLWDSHQVTLYSGTDYNATPFVVHKSFATYHSPILKAAFESNMIEGQTQVYRFESKFDENVVRILAHWFYTNVLDLTQLRGSNTGTTIQDPS